MHTCQQFEITLNRDTFIALTPPPPPPPPPPHPVGRPNLWLHQWEEEDWRRLIMHCTTNQNLWAIHMYGSGSIKKISSQFAEKRPGKYKFIQENLPTEILENRDVPIFWGAKVKNLDCPEKIEKAGNYLNAVLRYEMAKQVTWQGESYIFIKNNLLIMNY